MLLGTAATTPAPTTPVRTSFGDDLFLRRHRGLGSPIVNQFAWWHDEPVAPEAVAALSRRLAEGALGRRADRALLPIARDRWSRAPGVPGVVRGPLLERAGVLAWLRELAGGVDLDPASGHGWTLGLADLRDGGSVLALVVSHAAADGGAMLDAVRRATSGAEPLRTPERPALRPALIGDVRDAGAQLGEIVRWWRHRPAASAAAASAAPNPAAPNPAATAAPVVEVPGWRPPIVVLELATVDLTEAAARAGGSPNAWFVAWVADLVGRVRGTADPVALALPVSTRTEADLRSNATRIARVEVAPGERDLAVVRAASRAAYERLAAGAGAEPVPLALVQMLPDAVVRRFPQPPGAAALASNLGSPGGGFDRPAGVPARAVTSIAHHPGADAAEVRAIGGGVAAWASGCGDRTTLSVSGLDPDRLPDDDTLAGHALAALAAWDLPGTRW